MFSPRAWGIPATVLATGVGLAWGLTGCSDPMARIDRRVDAVVAERSNRVGTQAPTLAESAADTSTRRARLDPHPATTNPTADSLRYTPSDLTGLAADDLTREVSARLQRFGAEAAGMGASPEVLRLEGALRAAQSTAREHRAAEEDYLLSAIGLLIEQHRWSPRLFNDTSVDLTSVGEDGRFEPALGVINTLRMTKRLPFGGEAEARWVSRATEQLRSSVTGQYEQASELVFAADIPLLRGAGAVAREDLIQAEREVIYGARDFERFRREFFVAIATDYFELLETLAQVQNQIRQLRSLLAFQAQRSALYDAGRISKFEVEEAANRVLSAESSLASLRERYTLQLDRFKVRLGLDPATPLRLSQILFDLDQPAVTLDAATDAALRYRLDLQNLADQLDDTRRQVDNARNNLLPDLNLGGEAAIPTDGDTREGGVGFDPDDAELRASANLSLPLDRRIERLQLRQAQIRYDRALRDFERFRDDTALEARQRVREIDLARFRLELAERQVQINERRRQEQLIREDEIDTNRRLDTENDLLNAMNARDAAATDLRVAVLQYLLSTGQMRVSPEGTLQPLEGMVLRSIDPGAMPGQDPGAGAQPLDYDELFGPVSPEAPPGQG